MSAPLPRASGSSYEQAVSTVQGVPAVAVHTDLLWPRASSEQLSCQGPTGAAQQLLAPEAPELCAALHAKGCCVCVVGVGDPAAVAGAIAAGPLAGLITHQHILPTANLHAGLEGVDEQQQQQLRQKRIEQHWARLRFVTGVPCADTLAFCSCTGTMRAANRAGMRAAVLVRGIKGLTIDALCTGICLYRDKAGDDRGF